MANEISIQASLSCVRDVITVQASGSRTVNQTGTKALMTQVTAPTTTAFTLIDTTKLPLANCGYLFVKNMDAANYVEISTDSTFTAANIIARLNGGSPGDFCFLPINKSPVPTLYVRANTAAVIVLVAAAEM